MTFIFEIVIKNASACASSNVWDLQALSLPIIIKMSQNFPYRFFHILICEKQQ